MSKGHKGDCTTIEVKKDTALALRDLGKMGDSYDAVIRRLLNGKKPKEVEEPSGDG